MRSAFGTTHRTNRESERDAHRVRNTNLEETYGTPNTLAQKNCLSSFTKKGYALPRPEILRMLPSTKAAVAPVPAKV